MRNCARWTAILAAVLIALPAEAHVVYFKDGTSMRGTVTVHESTIDISGGGVDLAFPLDTVRAVSFSDEPIVYEQRRVEDSKLFNSDVLLWSAVGVNLLAIAAAAFALSRPGAAPVTVAP